MRKKGNYPWSPKLHKAYLIHYYWTLKHSSKRTGCQYPQAFAKIEAQVPPAKLKSLHLRRITANLREAQESLHSIHQEALTKRQTHLKDLIKAAHTCKDQKWKKLILCLKCAEELKQCYQLVCSITKPRQHGGLSHVRIPTHNPPDQPQWEAIYDPSTMEDLVLNQHRKHFSQAQGTVFTQEPLQSLINNQCTNKYAQQISAGTAPIENLSVNEHTKALLRHLKSKTHPSKPTYHLLDPEALIQGFKNGRNALPLHHLVITLGSISP